MIALTRLGVAGCVALRAPGRRRRGLLASAAATVALTATAAANATPPVTLVYETRVTVEARLLITGPVGKIHESSEVLRGLAGERLIFAETARSPAGPLAIGVVIEATPDEASGLCRLNIDADVRHADEEPIHVTRRASTEAGRLLLVDVWSDPGRGLRATLALTPAWEKIPSLTTLVPGAEPLELVVEVLLGEKGESRVVERHMLRGVVGAPISYTFRQLPGGVEEDGSNGQTAELRIDVLPREIDGGRADLDISLRHAGESPYSHIASLNLAVREKLAPGHSVSLPLPRSAEGVTLAFRVTPYF
jgi:hypothetical protein